KSYILLLRQEKKESQRKRRYYSRTKTHLTPFMCLKPRKLRKVKGNALVHKKTLYEAAEAELRASCAQRG
ncbi:hypothetical protein HispidOSU_019296, partial [Sigmodon hispidus]